MPSPLPPATRGGGRGGNGGRIVLGVAIGVACALIPGVLAAALPVGVRWPTAGLLALALVAVAAVLAAKRPNPVVTGAGFGTLGCLALQVLIIGAVITVAAFVGGAVLFGSYGRVG